MKRKPGGVTAPEGPGPPALSSPPRGVRRAAGRWLSAPGSYRDLATPSPRSEEGAATCSDFCGAEIHSHSGLLANSTVSSGCNIDLELGKPHSPRPPRPTCHPGSRSVPRRNKFQNATWTETTQRIRMGFQAETVSSN